MDHYKAGLGDAIKFVSNIWKERQGANYSDLKEDSV